MIVKILCQPLQGRVGCMGGSRVLLEHVRPPQGPPMDCYIWGVVERETNQRPHNTNDSLKAAIVDVMANMNENHLIRASSRFQSRIEAVIEAEGGFIE